MAVEAASLIAESQRMQKEAAALLGETTKAPAKKGRPATKKAAIA